MMIAQKAMNKVVGSRCWNMSRLDWLGRVRVAEVEVKRSFIQYGDCTDSGTSRYG